MTRPRPIFRQHLCGALFGVVAQVEPRGVVAGARGVQQRVVVVHYVGHAVIAKRAQPAERDRFKQAHLIRHVVVAQTMHVAVVGAIGRGGQAQQETGLQLGQHALIAVGGSVMKFVHHHVIEITG